MLPLADDLIWMFAQTPKQICDGKRSHSLVFTTPPCPVAITPSG